MSKYYTRSGQVARRENKTKSVEVKSPLQFEWCLLALMTAWSMSLGVWTLGLPVGLVLIPSSVISVMVLQQYKTPRALAVVLLGVYTPAVLLGGGAFTTVSGVIILGATVIVASKHRSYLWYTPSMTLFSIVFSLIYFLTVTDNTSNVVWIVSAVLDTIITSGFCLLLLEVARAKVKQSYLRKE